MLPEELGHAAAWAEAEQQYLKRLCETDRKAGPAHAVPDARTPSPIAHGGSRGREGDHGTTRGEEREVPHRNSHSSTSPAAAAAGGPVGRLGRTGVTALENRQSRADLCASSRRAGSTAFAE